MKLERSFESLWKSNALMRGNVVMCVLQRRSGNINVVLCVLQRISRNREREIEIGKTQVYLDHFTDKAQTT